MAPRLTLEAFLLELVSVVIAILAQRLTRARKLPRVSRGARKHFSPMIDMVFFFKKVFKKLHFCLCLSDDLFLTPGTEKEILNLGSPNPS